MCFCCLTECWELAKVPPRIKSFICMLSFHPALFFICARLLTPNAITPPIKDLYFLFLSPCLAFQTSFILFGTSILIRIGVFQVFILLLSISRLYTQSLPVKSRHIMSYGIINPRLEWINKTRRRPKIVVVTSLKWISADYITRLMIGSRRTGTFTRTTGRWHLATDQGSQWS